MKAKDYYKKYADRLLSPDSTVTAITELIKDFAAETGQLMDSRGVKTDRACEAIINEMNDKWNALARMFPVEVLKHNGWREYFWTCLNAAQKEKAQ